MERLDDTFYCRDVLEVAPDLIGKYIVLPPLGDKQGFMITEVEAYRGEEDKACHASKGRTPRTEIMYHEGGHVYVYLIYGMHWMLNIVTGSMGNPQAVLIRGIKGVVGPGKVAKHLGIDKTLYGENLVTSQKMGIYDKGENHLYKTSERVGIDYAGDYWRLQPWRYVLLESGK